ncbi:MAG: hypothetical protein IJ677_01960 [Alphaproteobacteria bacterium]|nr:hypothetical protein [Alphaproteobacteria bacterium]
MFFCMYGIWYIKRWRRKNPWYKQNDDEMRLSVQERMYRQNERRKYSNAPFMVLGAVIACMIPMMLMLQKSVNGGWHYAIPLLGALLLAALCVKR